MSAKRLIGMKTYHFRPSDRLVLGFTLFAIVGILLAGCKPPTDMNIAGVYIRSSDGVVDTMSLATNGYFEQTITFTNGGPWFKSGTWKFSGEVVELDTFYSVFDVDPLKHIAFVVVPPKSRSEVLWVGKGKLIKDSEQPIWFKQQAVK